MALVVPTTANDSGTASWGTTPATYTSTGSMTMEPPLPSRPSEPPTSAVSSMVPTSARLGGSPGVCFHVCEHEDRNRDSRVVSRASAS